MFPDKTPGPNDESSAYKLMLSTWQMIRDIRSGAVAIRAGGTNYLPKYEAESSGDYSRRKDSAPWRPEFNYALASLVAKPFSQDVAIKSGADDDEMKAIIEDVDTRGNNLTVFAREVMADGIANGLHAIFVEHTQNEGERTKQDEKIAGARPYFIHVKAIDLIAVYMAKIGSRYSVVHARIREVVTEVEGFKETLIEQVRVLEPGIWAIYRKNEKGDWFLKEAGISSLAYVPLVIYFTGERKGDHLVKSPLEDLAYLQLELYQALSRQDEVLNFSGFPMLSGNGFQRPQESIVVGPRSILYAPSSDGVQTSWSFVQPDAANIRELREHVAIVTSDIRRLGMQPMVQKSGGVTATATSIDSAKAHSVLQAWTIGLKDAIEQAFVIVADYKNIEAKIEIEISTDFSVEPFAQAPLIALKDARQAKDISQRTYWNGLRRFDVLPADFDPDEEDLLLAEETEGLEPEQQIDPITGVPAIVDPTLEKYPFTGHGTSL